MQAPRWKRWPRTLDGAWNAIEDIREEIEEMLSADMIEDAVSNAIGRQRRNFLSGFKGILLMSCAVLTSVASVADLVRGAFS